MDVGTISNVATQNLNQYATQNKTNAAKSAYGAYATTTQQTTTSSAVGDAYSLDISDAAKQAAAQQETENVDDAATGSKGLSADEVRYLQESIEMNQQTMLNMMIQALTDNNDKLQGWLDDGTGVLNFGGVQVDASRFALPEVATNPEDAAKAVADGGAWSVDAVSSRIFDLAEAISGGDPERLSQMREAVEQGFKEAGLTWTNATGLNDMPEITQKTYDDVMSRFDKRYNELLGVS